MKKIVLIILLFFPVKDALGQFNLDKMFSNAIDQINRHDFPASITTLNTLIEYKPDNFVYYYYRGLSKFYLDDNQSALEDFDRALAINPLFTDAYHYRGLVKSHNEDTYGAIADLSKALEQDKENAQLWLDRAISHLDAKDYTHCMEDCKKAISLKLNNETVYLCMAFTESGLKNYEKAIINLNRAMSINPFNNVNYIRRGMIESSFKKYDDALRDFEIALKNDSTNTFARYNKAMVYMDQENYKAAVSDFSRILRNDPFNALVYFNRAVAKSKLNDEKGAFSDLTAAADINPENIQLFLFKAKIEHNQKKYKAALQDYDKVIQLFPYHVEAFYNRSILKEAMGDLQGAKKDFAIGKSISELNRIKPDWQKEKDSLLLIKLSHFSGSFDNSESMVGAGKDKNAAYKLKPFFWISTSDTSYRRYTSNVLNIYNKAHNSSFILANPADDVKEKASVDENDDNITRAITLTRNRNYDKALALYNKVISTDSTNFAAYFNRGLVSFKLKQSQVDSLSFSLPDKNQFNTALNDIDKAIKLQPNFSYSYFNKALILSSNSDYDNAIRNYDTCLKLNPELAEAYFNRGILLVFTKDIENACKNISKAGELGIVDAYILIKKFCN